MTTLKWYEGFITKQAQLRWYNGTITRTPAVAKKLKWYAGTITRTPVVKVDPILDQPALEPGVLATQVAKLQSPATGTLTWDQEQLSGPDVILLNPISDTIAFYVPSVMPGDETSIVIGITATINGVPSTQTEANFTALPQVRWVYDGTKLIGATPHSTAGPLVAARSAQSVADKLGVQVHMASDFPIYGDMTQVTALVNDLGVKHLRDTYNWNFPTQHAHQKTLAADTGAKFTMTTRYSDSISNWISGMVADSMGPVCVALEGINEPDSSGGSWASLTFAHQQAFYAAVKAAPSLAALPVLAPGLANSITNAAALAAIGDLSPYCDRGNAHIYSGNPPTGTGSYTIANTQAQARLVAGSSKPVVITEQGYHNAPADNTPIPYVDETTAGVYAPKILLDNVLAGTERVFLYELIDQGTGTDDQQHYGLCRNDYTKKPAFTAVKALLAVLNDPGSPYTPDPLPLTITPPEGDTTLRSLLVGRRDGTYRLLLWRDVAVWNPTTHTPVTVAPITVTVTHPTGTSTVSLAGTLQTLTIP